MKNTLTPARLAAALKRVPEKRFRITQLAPRLLDGKGKVDIEKCMAQQEEINLAVLEVQSYVRAAGNARRALEYIGRGRVRVYEGEFDYEDIEVEEGDG